MMSQELEDEIDLYVSNSNKDNIFNHPIIQTLLSGLGAIPTIGSVIETGIASKINACLKKEQEKRLSHICELIISDKNITPDKVSNVKEIISFAKMLDVARKLITNDKLDYLVRLYKKLVTQDEKNYDEYEEFLRRLDELSYRELEILHILDEVDLAVEDLNKNKQDAEKYHIQIQHIEEKWLKFQDIILQKFEIAPLDLQGHMQSISRSGFCVQYKETDMPIRANSIFVVTQYYRNFAKKIYQ